MSENVEYARWWLDVSRKELEKKPRSNLAYCVVENISGGKRGWEPEIEAIFARPDGLEEVLAQAEVRDVLRIALKNSLALTEKRMRDDGITAPWTAWKALDLGFAFSLAERVASFDPLLSVIAKTEMNRISMRLGESLYIMATRAEGIYMVPDVGISW